LAYFEGWQFPFWSGIFKPMGLNRFESKSTDRLMESLRSALNSSEGNWGELASLLPWFLDGTNLVVDVRGDRPAPDLEDLRTAFMKVFEGYYTRREDPSSQLVGIATEEIADRLERRLHELRSMRSPTEVDFEIEKTHRQLGELRKSCGEELSRVQDQQIMLLHEKLGELYREKQSREEWKARVLESLINLDDYVCIRK
jgi:hypothetical protein